MNNLDIYPTSFAARMWLKVDISDWELDPNAHWWWTGGTAGACSTSPEGYGRLNLTTEDKVYTVYAHRWFYEEHVGPIPDGFHINHLCRVTICVNPDHLEAVTPSQNTRYSKIHSFRVNAAKTHCKNGHPFSGDNLRLGTRGRICRACSQRRYNPELDPKRAERYIRYLEFHGYEVKGP